MLTEGFFGTEARERVTLKFPTYFRANRFGFPVYPQRHFGLPSPEGSGPVSFAGFTPDLTNQVKVVSYLQVDIASNMTGVQFLQNRFGVKMDEQN